MDEKLGMLQVVWVCAAAGIEMQKLEWKLFVSQIVDEQDW